MANIYVPSPEQLGRRRFPDNKSFRKNLATQASDILSLLSSLLPSNYPKDPSTNLSIFNSVTARESARLNISMGSINNDKQWTATRIRYLQQILGERLFLSGRLAPPSYNDESYRDYLIAIKNAYLAGSTKSNIESIASQFSGLEVRIKELYLEAREPNSSLDISSTNKMVVDVFVDDMIKAGRNVQMLTDELTFFINLVRPAHVLYDTRFIWTEELDVNKTTDLIFGDTGGGCIPTYDYIPFGESTWLAQQVFILDNSTGATGLVDSIHNEDLLFYLDDSTRIITEPGIQGTRFYKDGRRVTFNSLEIGQYVFINYEVIPGDFQFWWLDPIIADNWISRFYKDTYRRPIFQEFVKKIMDSKGRFPLQVKTTPTTICDRWVQDALQPLYEDARQPCTGDENTSVYDSTLQERMGYPKLSWPYSPPNEVFDSKLLGNDYAIDLLYKPLTDGSSNPATINDITTTFDGTSISGDITSVDASSARINLTTSDTYWDSTAGRFPRSGDEFVFSYHYLSDGTNYDASTSYIFGISYWQMPHSPIVAGNGNGDLAGTSDMTVSVNGTLITGAVSVLAPLMGHVTLQSTSTFWNTSALGRVPQIGDVFEFDYKWGEKYQYSAIFDDPGRIFDAYVDTDPFGMTFDCDLNRDPEISAVIPFAPVEIGYRWRAYLLQHSSVLNSPDTLTLNTFQKPGNRASIANQMDVLNHYNKVFSPEFLYDENTVDVKHLDDKYLDNGLTPVLQLREGIPPFQETFWSHEGLIRQQKIQDIRTVRHPLIYSDLLMKEFLDSGDSVPLNSICESNNITFRIRMGQDDISHISECSPWVLFDSRETKDVTLTIPGEMAGVPSLRVPGIYLRESFILRDVEPTGTTIYSYSVHTPEDREEVFYQLPTFFSYTYQGDVYDFPTIPIMKNTTTVADVNDIEVKLDGVITPGLIKSIDPVTGLIELYSIPPYRIDDYITLTQMDIVNKELTLSSWPDDPQNIAFNIINGPSQYMPDDFFVQDQKLIWRDSPLEGILEVGDRIRVSYFIEPLINVDLEFTYRILSTGTVTVEDPDRSRIFDDKYVFDGGCPDIEDIDVGWKFSEYINFIDDYSSGIKLSYFNNSSQQIEERMFSGPVFEYYSCSEDQIGSPQNFPNALVRVQKSITNANPLNNRVDYAFMNDKVVRFRKKTFKELLPDRTFRTTKLTEMLPV